MRRKQTPEGELQRLVLDWLAAEHILSFRMNSGTLRNGVGRPVTFGTPGMADVLAFPWKKTNRELYVRSGFLNIELEEIVPTWIELKAPKGKQTEMQKSFQAQVETAGHHYLLIRSLEELKAALRPHT